MTFKVFFVDESREFPLRKTKTTVVQQNVEYKSVKQTKNANHVRITNFGPQNLKHALKRSEKNR